MHFPNLNFIKKIIVKPMEFEFGLSGLGTVTAQSCSSFILEIPNFEIALSFSCISSKRGN